MVLKFSILLILPICISCTVKPDQPTLIKADQHQIIVTGEELYTIHCEACHGIQGDKGISGAADLSRSEISDTVIKNTIEKGNNKGMMQYKDIITSVNELDSIVKFVKKLRK